MTNYIQARDKKRLAIATIALGSLFAGYCLINETSPNAASIQAQATSTRISSQQQPSSTAVEISKNRADTAVPDGLLYTTDKHFIVNKEVRNVFDYFLLGGLAGSRQQNTEKLFAHLKTALPKPASDEAIQLAQKYLNYLAAHDQLLAQTRPSLSGSGPIEVWLSQRTRLRQSELGVDVARIWYADEEIEEHQKLTEVQNGTSLTESVNSDRVQQAVTTLNTMRMQGANEKTQRAAIAEKFGEAAAQRFEISEQKEQAWQQRYANYRREIREMQTRNTLSADEFNQQIAWLRKQTFLSEAEQLRASTLDLHSSADGKSL